jgi:hypothetical protein
MLEPWMTDPLIEQHVLDLKRIQNPIHILIRQLRTDLMLPQLLLYLVPQYNDRQALPQRLLHLLDTQRYHLRVSCCHYCLLAQAVVRDHCVLLERLAFLVTSYAHPVHESLQTTFLHDVHARCPFALLEQLRVLLEFLCHRYARNLVLLNSCQILKKHVLLYELTILIKTLLYTLLNRHLKRPPLNVPQVRILLSPNRRRPYTRIQQRQLTKTLSHQYLLLHLSINFYV